MPTLINITQQGFQASASAASIPWNSVIGVPAGRTVLITVGFWGTNQTAAISIVANHLTFALVRRDTNASGTYTQAIYIAFNPTLQVNTATFSIASGTPGPCFASIAYGTSIDSTTPVVVSSGAFGSGLVSTSPAITAAGGALYLAHGHAGTPSTPTDPAISTVLLNGQSGGVPCFATWAGLAVFSGTVAAQSSTWNQSGDWIAQIVGLAEQSATQHFVVALSETASGPPGESLDAAFAPGPPPKPPRVLGDVALVWASFAEGGDIDATIIDDDIGADQGLRTAVLLSLFIDRRALADDVLPSDDGDRRGWWGDEFAIVEGDLIGSRLWLLDRSARRADIAQSAEEFAKEALAWMLEDRVASSVGATAEVDGEALFLTIALTRPNGDPVAFKFKHAWDVSPAGLPA